MTLKIAGYAIARDDRDQDNVQQRADALTAAAHAEAMTTSAVKTVRDYTALLSGFSLNDRAGVGVFVSFSFPDRVPSVYDGVYDAAGLSTFRELTDVEKADAREAIAAWASASGVTAFEVAPGEGDIRFMVFDLDRLTPSDDEAAFAYLPTALDGDGVESDVFLDSRYATDKQILLHEIGHALGLKHPFDDTPVLASDLDNFGQTVMSYTPGAFTGTTLGPLDIAAIHALYGSNAVDGKQIESWSWNAATLTLTQSGSAKSDQIIGIGGADHIVAGKGDDTIYAHEGNNTIDGGSGADSIDGGYGVSRIAGGDGNDTIAAWGRDVVNGGSGDDAIEFDLELANDVVRGGHGDDDFTLTYKAHRAFTLDGGGGDDVLTVLGEMKDGNARIDWGDIAKNATITSVEGLVFRAYDDSSSHFIGSQFGDTMWGDGYTSNFEGMSGDDVLHGGKRNNLFLGGDGDDRLYGGAADDSLRGGADNDTIEGSGGRDLLDGGSGSDILVGGAQNDVYIVDNAEDTVVENKNRGTDTVQSTLLSYTLVANVENLILQGGGIEGIGNSYANNIHGDARNNMLSGMGGNDSLYGDTGTDTLDGGAGDDLLTTIYDGLAVDRLIGGTGNDEFAIDTADVVVEQRNGGNDTVDTIGSYSLPDNVENLVTSGAGAVGTGNSLDNVVSINNYNVLASTLIGLDGDDTLIGGYGQDITLIGGSGVDVLTSYGLTTFRFEGGDTGASDATADRITSWFVHDKIDLKAIDAIEGGKDDKFKFIGEDAFHGKAGELRAYHDETHTYVAGDTDGDGIADLLIAIDGIVTIKSDNFIH